MKKYLGILRKCPLFTDISENELPRMLLCLGASVMSFAKDETVLAEGEPAASIGIVLSGRVQVVRMDYYGNRSILFEVGTGGMFGEAFACAEAGEMPVSVIADEPCEVMTIDGGHILHTCEKHCAFHERLIFNLMKDLAEKNIRLHRKVEITAKRTTREKLMAYLMLCAKERGTAAFEIPFDRQELADYLEVDRSGLSAEIGKLKREGVLECEKSRFQLL